MKLNSSDRFTDRVADYVRFRPDYPAAALDVLNNELGLARGTTVADIGAGTGLLTLPLLNTGAQVSDVDPNPDMLQAAREYLRGNDNLTITVGTAESSGLPDHSVDAITAGQAFHWFGHALARTEFLRILKPGCKVALMWNVKDFAASAFLAGYQALLDRHAPEFAHVRHEAADEHDIAEFYGRTPSVVSFPHEQRFDWLGVYGRVMSSSYVPKPDQPGHEPLVSGLRALFDEHAVDGAIVWPYSTHVYIGELTS